MNLSAHYCHNAVFQTKAAFTRQYNKESHLTPYAAVTGAKKRKGRGAAGGEGLLEEGEEAEAAALEVAESDADNSDDPDADAMIKVTVSPAVAAQVESVPPEGFPSTNYLSPMHHS